MHFRNHYSKGKLINLVIYLTLTTSFSHQNKLISLKINGIKKPTTSSYEINSGDKLEFNHQNKVYWLSYKPIYKEYSNKFNSKNGPEKIGYEQSFFSDSLTQSLLLDSLQPGTHYFGYSINKTISQIALFKPLQEVDPTIIQIVVKEDSSYVGFLTELLGTPFILPPIKYSASKHQTDFRVGTDCAELAIYGVRRLGYNVPYIGPKLIYKYLRKTKLLRAGTVLHFGFQVSVVYKDYGNKGALDEEDLLIHAFENKVKIQPLGSTNLKKRLCQLFEWDWASLPKNNINQDFSYSN